MDAKQKKHLELLALRLENSGLAEYVKLSQRTGKILWLNFISGVAKGLGFAIGATLVMAVFFKIIGYIISMNIPYLTELLKNILELVKSHGI
jgi:hypothetical protein